MRGRLSALRSLRRRRWFIFTLLTNFIENLIVLLVNSFIKDLIIVNLSIEHYFFHFHFLSQYSDRFCNCLFDIIRIIVWNPQCLKTPFAWYAVCVHSTRSSWQTRASNASLSTIANWTSTYDHSYAGGIEQVQLCFWSHFWTQYAASWNL